MVLFKCSSFSTYNYVELYPGPNLNLILGPNGTGKSTIVAAIILGLGGSPKVIGRGSKVSEYVKYGCTESRINIFLETGNDKYLTITRIITIDDKTKWWINNVNALQKDVINAVKEYNIQVDNLCQFLAQDRVQDFAKMNQQDLLKATQSALGRNDLIELQKQLIDHSEQFKNSHTTLRKNKQNLEQQINANARLEGKMESFNKKQEYLKTIKDIDRKITWLEYDEIRQIVTETRNDMEKANAICEKYKKESQPILKEINNVKKKITEFQTKKSDTMKSNRNIEASIREKVDKVKDCEQKISDTIIDRDIELSVIDEKEKEIETTKKKMDEMQKTHQELLKQYDTGGITKNKIDKLTGEIQKLRNHQRGIEDKKDDCWNNRQDQTAQVRAMENELLRLENIKQKRLDYLKRVDKDAYESVLWLRNNKHLFQGEIYEPIMLELNMFDPQKAIYVENAIPFRERVAFACCLKEDMNLLINHLRIGKQLKVNIIHTPINQNNYQPRIPIERLQRYGFYAYINTLFQLPEPVMQYLCATYRIYEIPVGDQNVDNCFDKTPNEIRSFFSNTQRYSINLSRYSGEKIITQNKIRSDGGFSINVDVLRIQNLKNCIVELKNQINSNDEYIKESNNQIERINENITQVTNELRNIQKHKQQLQMIEDNIKRMQHNINEMQMNSGERETIRSDAAKKIHGFVKSLGLLHEDIAKRYACLTECGHKIRLYDGKIDISRQQIMIYEQQITETQRLCGEAEKTLNQIRNKYHDVKAKATIILQKAKSLSNNCTRNENGFDEFRGSFEQLSDNLCELEDNKQQLLCKIDRLVTVDDNELKEYEERAELIEKLQNDIESHQYRTNQMQSQIDQLQQDWLLPLNELLDRINLKFSEYFDKMGYSGCVSLNTNNNEKEFSQYGLLIKVSFRKSEPLQPLNTIIQSGGERAVTTAVFMLSLQELTPAPFRCVDEINQGMDPVNERKVFALIVDCTKETNTSQFFLITPKLLPNLKYTPSMMVHIVHNGPYVDQDCKWSASQFSNPQGVQIH